MRFVHSVAVAIALINVVPQLSRAQDVVENSRGVAGGIKVPGWMGKPDDAEAAKGLTVDSASFTSMGGGFHVQTGPAITYWNLANKASGNYTVKATFSEPKFQMSGTNPSPHPHPYGIMIGGNDLGTPQQSYLYCSAYGSGTFIVRGFGPTAFQMNGRAGAPSDAVHKAAGQGQPVMQEIAIAVSADKVDCIINGTVVGSYPKSALVMAGKLKSTDGVYGLRFAHNTEAMVTGLTVTKN